jgi:hypothetical protein
LLALSPSTIVGSRTVATRPEEGIVKFAVICFLAVAIGAATMGSSDARAPRRATNYDGPWHLSFATQSGSCDASYDFDVNILNGLITHPNLVRFQGRVAPGGAARASVTVQDKYASGAGRLTGARGRGTWKGRSGTSMCSGVWTAQRN